MNNQSHIDYKSEADKAALAACRILAYSDNTERQLRRKLREKGFCSDVIDAAVDYVREKGFLDEERMLEPVIRNLVRYKYYGVSRIKKELAVKGFERELVDGYDFSQIDFLEVCRELFNKHGGIPDEKTYAFLLRHGHRSSDIRQVFEEADE